jgi:hypothetical protein
VKVGVTATRFLIISGTCATFRSPGRDDQRLSRETAASLDGQVPLGGNRGQGQRRLGHAEFLADALGRPAPTLAPHFCGRLQAQRAVGERLIAVDLPAHVDAGIAECVVDVSRISVTESESHRQMACDPSRLG